MSPPQPLFARIVSDIPFRLARLDHVVLRVRDVARMEAFYCNVLGCSVEKRQERYGLLQLRAGDSLIDLVDVEGEIGRAGGAAPGDEAHNMDHFCLQVDSFDHERILAWLEQHDVAIEEFGNRYGALGRGPSQYLLDPEGNRVELKGSA